ncbi:ATP phosphoribosyltransferase regulatory subunit [Paracoccus tegillarcae]|uniref:ATP phosphoribosyltransferase regulatory subunit n=1 Tax=Paracoccus tegillarcae TaxID=1529068 RepID=A0A2K9EN83_9RHOB|nr:ATP phosphoribosyltransferase regulatory subunit [Paracoccus tegillarcae]AUH32156.1 ATP phosphoribosyltransferase regulatory subunit [Paracoccus tegillarcae]
MTGKREKQLVGQRLLAAFRDAGAVEVAPDILLPAETLLDLYGEDIRARAYLTDDPLRGEVALRPDFTVPVVQMHMENGAEPARYCYLGEIFRKQDPGETRPDQPRDNEYLQAGFELFSRDTDADAEVFALFYRLLDAYGLSPAIGDMGLLMDAVRALPLPAPRRDALLHHIWRPRRFAALLTRFSAPSTARAFAPSAAPLTGLRGMDEIQTRLDRLAADADVAPLPAEWGDRLTRLFAIAGPAPDAMNDLARLSDDIPAIQPAIERLAARLDAIAARGIDTRGLHFDASHGRQTMEYYDGFTFSFTAADRSDWPPIASGGRYDALTAQLGKAGAIPAVGGIVRPGLIAELEAAPC